MKKIYQVKVSDRATRDIYEYENTLFIDKKKAENLAKKYKRRWNKETDNNPRIVVWVEELYLSE